MTGPSPRRTDEFVGREEQFERLIAVWRDLREGLSGPRVVTLLAEPGLGKTRLAQEFYRWLVVNEQGGEGYWPADLHSDENNLQVNPTEGGWNPAAPVPFLWWGIRLTDPGEWNRVTTGALPGHVEQFLAPHLEPFHREQRQRQRLRQLAKVGGAVAADAVIDLIPFLGLVKKVGEVGLELKGIHDEWRRDAEVPDAAGSIGRRRSSLVEQLIMDLEKLFSGPAGRRVPAVILLDDAQFSGDDPALTAFVEALLPAMTEGRWPLLLLVTHWQREWADAELSPVAVALKRHAHQELEGVLELALEPLPDLEPLLRATLSGLTEEQSRALLERAGGNPRFLIEIVRYALGPVGRSLFVARDAGGAMTDTGLAKLLAKSVKLNDVITERLVGAPEPVQKAVVLAGLQGQEFSEWLLAALADELADEQLTASPGAVTAAVDEAASPHALVARLSSRRAAFSQRIYQEVARELLPAWYDEDEAALALREVVRRALTSGAPAGVEREDSGAEESGAEESGAEDTGYENSVGQLADLYSLAVALFGAADDPEELRLAVHALHQLLEAAQHRNDLHAAHALAVRQVEMLARLPDDNLDGELAWLRRTNDALAAYGDHDRQRGLLVRLIELSGEAYDDDANEWSVATYVEVLLDAAEFHQALGSQQQREAALVQAAAALEHPELAADDLRLLNASLRLHRLHAAWFRENGRFADALTMSKHTAALTGRLAELEPGPVNRFQEAASLAQIGSGSLLLGNLDAAAASLERAIAEFREILAGHPEPALEIRLAATLDDLGEVLGRTGELERAAKLLDESLALMRRHFAAAPEALQTHDNLADSLERVAELARIRGDLDHAWDQAAEAVELRRAVVARTFSSAAAANLGLALVRLAALASERADHATGLGLAEEGLALLRHGFVTEGGVSERWRLLLGLRVAVPLAVARSGLAAAKALLDEALTLIGGIPEEAFGAFSPLVRDLEALSTEVSGLAGG